MTQPDQSMMTKILALLAKAEMTEFEEEASAYLAKAQELMIKHAVAESDLKPTEREKIVVESIPQGTSKPDRILMYFAAKSADVQLVHWTSARRTDLIGFPSDIAFAKSLYASLVLQREAAVSRAQIFKPEWEHGKTYNHSFRIGYASRVGKRLDAARTATVSDLPGTALVLRSKEAAVTEFKTANFGKLRRASSVSTYSRTGYARGDLAGREANVSGGRNTVGARGALR